jgi:hypothetical protein
VAIYGGSRVTMPYAMGVMGSAMMQEYFKSRPPTLGQTILAAKRRMMAPLDEKDPLGNVNRFLLDGVAAVISPSPDMLEEERREHLYLFNLIGDPMLKLTYPEEVVLTAPREAQPGQKLRISGKTAVAGQGVLELICRRDQFKSPPPKRERFDPRDAALAEYQGVYEQTLDRCFSRWALDLPQGDFATDITIPDDCQGPCHVRLLVAGEKSHALGSANLLVKAKAPERSASLPDEK